MTKEELEKLRNENRDNIVEVYHKVAQLYENFAEIIKNGGILTDDDFGKLNDVEFIEVPFKDEHLILTYLFSEAVEEEMKENER